MIENQDLLKKVTEVECEKTNFRIKIESEKLKRRHWKNAMIFALISTRK